MAKQSHNQPAPGLGPADLIERSQWDLFWVPDDVRVVDRPEILYLCCERDVPMLNCVTRTRAAPERLEELAREVSAAHARVRSRWLVRARPGADALERALDGADYRPTFHADARVLAVSGYHREAPSELTVRPVDSMERLLDCLAAQEQAFDDHSPQPESQLRGYLEDCTRPNARVHRFVAYDPEGEPISAGGMTSFPDLSFGYLWGGGTVPGARGRGAYTAVVAARVARAQQIGLTHLGVYAKIDTSSPIVERQGFERCGSMAYWDRAPLRTP